MAAEDDDKLTARHSRRQVLSSLKRPQRYKYPSASSQPLSPVLTLTEFSCAKYFMWVSRISCGRWVYPTWHIHQNGKSHGENYDKPYFLHDKTIFV